ncbi:tyramine receptor 1-like [Paramuricea clavata]|uniref:Tyramine receptor 1-like n=1 Tax=Paramuricea clavata TaxID=317549 RepID=A0A6S7GDQ7_PARCT|nr:tyramine receptor 1-like [Paramuricea clavata]
MKEWNSPLCTINGYLGMMFCMTSLQTLTIVSVDRYVAIVTPFRYHIWMTSQRVKIIIATKWTLAASVAAVPLSGWGKYIFYPQKGFCFIDYHKDFEIFFFIGAWFMIGFGVITFTYYYIFKEARRQKRQIQALTVANNNVRATRPENTMPENSGINSAEHSSQANPEAKTERQQYRNNLKRIKNENKAALTIFAIIAGFLVCWMPFVLVNFTAALISFHIPEWLDVLSTLLVATGSMVNPLFYAWLDSSFRLAFKRLLFPIFGRVGSAPITAVSNYSGAGANL